VLSEIQLFRLKTNQVAKKLIVVFKIIHSKVSFFITGLKLPVFINPMLVCDIDHMSGILFQLVAGRNRNDILAVGGRYDKLISKFPQGHELPQGYGAVGAIINTERVATLLLMTPPAPDDVISSTCDVMVCVHGENPKISTEIRHTMAELRRNGISASISYETLSDIFDSQENLYVVLKHYRTFGTQHVVIFSEEERPMVC
jgi:histidyl-tRNA synthetase